jgi:hypothetical protein
LRGIKKDGAINASRWGPIGVDVETEPFGTTVPGIGGSKADTGAVGFRNGKSIEHYGQSDYLKHVTFEELGLVSPGYRAAKAG